MILCSKSLPGATETGVAISYGLIVRVITYFQR